MRLPSDPYAGYLDAASSEPLHPAARDALLAALDKGWADPRRLHAEARNARLILDNAREAAAAALGVRRDELTFTSSGTDAVHRGVLGLLGGRRRGSTLLHSAVEHSSVLHAAAWAATMLDTRAQSLPVDREGRLSPATVREALAATTGTAMLAVQSANHEVGTLQPLEEIAARAAERGTPLFVDACASLGRVPLPGGWAAAAGSAHKWGGPAGVGVLLVRKGSAWRNPYPVDDRADERGCGFENVPAALAAAAALQAVVAEQTELAQRQHAMVARVREAVAALPDVEVVGAPDARLPHLVTFSCLYVDGEALVTRLAQKGFGVASGSACTASTLTPSHVLEAMGVLTHGNVRLSLTRTTTAAEVDSFLAVLPQVVHGIRAEVGL
ncbi:cysteine desulfurase family protein [Nocardioides jiangxiensis]|uniref:Aminotransferase class V-fold PLP-dependent enzyme n=1 Tax=Nocardioides jiangxiensis TaxID=3064524 RepID=A0ABT9B332_9ACTN|nr:aminotransferase class V-fold PLP-dependent enzyme [Nocardioides sp. WY-20]MDO7869262.1 aminotransferase class V-fold PLP-dependent enzyme [Nocardioides sp. WY-20]